MSIFRRDPEPASPSPPSPARPAPRPTGPQAGSDHTHIASGSKVVGEISGSAELQIDGLVQGKINLQSRVVIGPKGTVEGEIKARSIEIGGKVVGNVHGSERVEIKASGRLEGDLFAPPAQVHIAEGAFFTGKVEMVRPGGHDKPQAPGPGGAPAKPPEANQGKPQGDKPQGDKPQGDRPQGDKPQGHQGHQGRSGK